ncbi:MAG: bifunctional FO biosynthesis protein CofGH [Actinomycetota bacterium]|nr:bifunctional FO biosynthesis protein CofGH [Actinomycetota bacterium]
MALPPPTPPGAERSPSESALRRAVRRARDGRPLDVPEASVLLHARGLAGSDQLAELCRSAAAVRDAGLASAGRPGTVTYSRKVFVPLTRLCRDRCHYCTFAAAPARLHSLYLERDEVVALARRGAALGCKEALFTLGDRPERRWPQARAWLEERGYASTLEYVRACAIAVLEETGLLPHLNPGVMTWQEMQRLKPVAPSMGMMLETTSRRLYDEPGQPHAGSPDKDPDVRLRVLDDAGRLAVPFTTGILVGIGETATERAESLFAIRRTARLHGHVQEVIVQNFRAKPDTAMRSVPDVGLEEFLATVAVARLVLGPGVRLQAPPNLVDLAETRLLLGAGVDDWGGVSPLTPDHVNPERPWPDLDLLAQASAEAGFVLRERLTAHPPYVLGGEAWIDPRVQPHVAALAGADGLAVEGRRPEGRAWQEPDGGLDVAAGRTDLHASIDTTGRTDALRSDAASAYGDMQALAALVPEQARVHKPSARREVLRPAVVQALRAAQDEPAGISDTHALALLDAQPGAELDALAALADDVRRDAVGDEVTYVVNRNVNFTNVCYTGCRFCAFAQRRGDADAYALSLDDVSARAAEAWQAGATEVCMQGGIDPKLAGDGYFALARAVKRGAPGIHLHAYSPMEVVNGASRSGLSLREWLLAAKDAGVDSLPGTAAEILDDDVRWVLTKGKLPAAAWVEVVQTAHEVGLPTTSTMMYGHVDTPAHWVSHLRLLARLQSETGGFTEFVPLPFVHHNAPLYLAGIARPGPTAQENRAVHAVARLLLHGRIAHVQASWVKLGEQGTRQVLAGGVDDLGGTLMEETISRMAGSRHGSRRSVQELEALAASAGRRSRQRSTSYGPVPAERRAAALADPVAADPPAAGLRTEPGGRAQPSTGLRARLPLV